MIVNIYEILSPSLHRYAPLTDRGPYNASVFSSLGYFVLLPDIVFRPREPGRSIVECVTAAVKKVLEKGAVDGRRVGLVGHSWGGYGTAFTVTQTDLFAAAVSGAPLTNLSSSYGEIYWNSGLPETNHAETGQERMEVPLYEDPQAYIRNSATFFADKMKTPLLLAHGDKDGACDWRQSIELYNVARRAGKQAVLLVYPGENHSLSNKANQLDYHRRIREWFGHYLKGEPAPEWITRGTSHLEKQKELKRLKEAKPAPTS
jgi:dipeptidyl aminopeptidase/acylaminoacyl peptidase